MRGEYLSATVPAEAFDELPPRARRILQRAGQVSVGGGTTSACAENTPYFKGFQPYKPNYLRVRGEYIVDDNLENTKKELPPRARRIRKPVAYPAKNCGTTSACAENTVPPGRQRCRRRNYLRVRGEYITIGRVQGGNLELPPRARRIHRNIAREPQIKGTTSACAENT